MTKNQNPILTFFKSSAFLTTLFAVALFAAISWAYFYPDNLTGGVLMQADTKQGIANGQEAKLFTETTGEVTRWTGSLFSGMPTFQISPTYQSSGLLGWLNSLLGLGFPSPVNLIFIMMIGFYILMRSFDVKWQVAIIGAIGYCFSSYFFILIGAGHIWKFVTLAYIPPTLAGIVWCYRGKWMAGAAVAALFAALQLSWNHVQMTYYSLFIVIAIVVAYLITAIKEKTLKQWAIASGMLAVAAVLAVAANLPNLYNTYEYGKETMRGGHSEITAATAADATDSGLSRSYITAYSYQPDETFTLLVPNAFGGASAKLVGGSMQMMPLIAHPDVQKMVARQGLSVEDQLLLGGAPQYFSGLPQYFGEEGTNGPVYVGALIFALFLLGCVVVKGPLKWTLLFVTILAILLSWGRHFMGLTDFFIDYVPMYNKFRTVESILVVAELTMPLLAMLALHKVFTEEDFMKKHKVAVYSSFGVSAAMCLLIWIAPNIFTVFSSQELAFLDENGISRGEAMVAAVESARHAIITADALRSLIIVAIGFAILWLYSSGKIKTTVAAAAVCVVVLGDMYMVNKRYLDSESFTQPAANGEAFTMRPADAKILADTTMNYRVLDLKHLDDPMPSYFHKSIGGYHAAKLSRYNDLLNYQIRNNNAAVLNMLNTKYVIVDDTTVAENPEALGNAWFVNNVKYVDNANDEMAELSAFNPADEAVADKRFEAVLGKAQAVAETDTIFETSYAPNRLTYHAQSARGGVAVFSEVYFPWGWTATIDGNEAPIARVNYVLRALNVPAGSHAIEFVFDPRSTHVTDGIATCSILLIYLLLLNVAGFAIYKKLRKRGTEE